MLVLDVRAGKHGCSGEERAGLGLVWHERTGTKLYGIDYSRAEMSAGGSVGASSDVAAPRCPIVLICGFACFVVRDIGSLTSIAAV